MSVFAQANDATAQTNDFFAYDATGQVHNGSAFVAWVDANYASYRIAATEQGSSGGGSCEYTATLPTGTVRYKMRNRGATLLLSLVVWTEDVFPKLSDYLTGDSFARIGLAGAGLTALGDTRIANLDATISSRMATFSYTVPDNATITAIRAEQDADEAAIIAAVGAGVTAVEAFGGSGPWTRNTEPPTLASILAGIITDHGTGSYVNTERDCPTLDEIITALLGRELTVISPGGFDGQSLTLNRGEAYLDDISNSVAIQATHPSFNPVMTSDETEVWLRLKRRFSDDDAINVEGTIETVDGSTAVISFELPTTLTSALVPGDNAYRFDVEVILQGDSSLVVTPIADGQVNVRADI